MKNQTAFIADALAFNGIASFVSFTLNTQPKLLAKSRTSKAPRPFNSLTKVQSFVNAMIGAEYANRVNAQRVREGVEEAFESQKASGRTRLNALLSHKDGDADQLYLTIYTDKATVKNTVYIDDNGIIHSWESVKDYLNLPKQSNDKQGIENEIKVIAPKLESITVIQAFGNTY